MFRIDFYLNIKVVFTCLLLLGKKLPRDEIQRKNIVEVKDNYFIVVVKNT